MKKNIEVTWKKKTLKLRKLPIPTKAEQSKTIREEMEKHSKSGLPKDWRSRILK